jgi:hypothetical protein
MNKIILATGMMVGYAYAIEFFIAWYSGNPYEQFAFVNRALRPLRLGLLDHGVLQRRSAPQLFWFKKMPDEPDGAMWIIAMLVNVGMWFERFVIIVTSLSRDFLPSSWDASSRRGWTSLLRRQLRVFFTLFLLFCRFLPMVAMAEVKAALPLQGPAGSEKDEHHG